MPWCAYVLTSKDLRVRCRAVSRRVVFRCCVVFPLLGRPADGCDPDLFTVGGSGAPGGDGVRMDLWMCAEARVVPAAVGHMADT